MKPIRIITSSQSRLFLLCIFNFIFISQLSFGQTWTSVVDGRGFWTDNSSWDIANDIASFGAVGTDYAIISSGDTIVIPSDMSFGWNDRIIVRSGGLLIVDGDLDLSSWYGELTVEDGGGLMVLGDLEITEKADFVLDGVAIVTGDLNISTDGNGVVSDENGELYVFGTVTENCTGGSCNNSSPATQEDLENDAVSDPNIADFIDAYNQETGSSLPVELVFFEVKSKIDENYLVWQTASELNNDGFEIQCKSEYDADFRTLDFVVGNGTTNEVHNYEYRLTENHGLCYYRLKQVDFDGKYEYSRSLSIYSEEAAAQLVVYPNPTVTGQVQIKGRIERFDLLDMNGRLLLSQMTEDTDHASKEISNLLSENQRGVYLLNLYSANSSQRIKIVRQ